MGYGPKRRPTRFTAPQGRFSPPARGVRLPRPNRGPAGSLALLLRTLPAGLRARRRLPGRGGPGYGAYPTTARSEGLAVERLLTVREAARLLGVREQTLYLWVSLKRVPHRKLGRLVRFTVADLEQYVEEQKQVPAKRDNEPL